MKKQKFRYKEERKKLKDCPLKSLHNHDKEKELKHKLEKELAVKDKMINLIWIDLFHLNNDNNDWTKSLDKYKQEAQAKLKELKGYE